MGEIRPDLLGGLDGVDVVSYMGLDVTVHGPCNRPLLGETYQVIFSIKYQTREFPSVRPASSSVTLRPPPQDSETGWALELWLNTNIPKWQNLDIIIFFLLKNHFQNCLFVFLVFCIILYKYIFSIYMYIYIYIFFFF